MNIKLSIVEEKTLEKLLPSLFYLGRDNKIKVSNLAKQLKEILDVNVCSNEQTNTLKLSTRYDNMEEKINTKTVKSEEEY